MNNNQSGGFNNDTDGFSGYAGNNYSDGYDPGVNHPANNRSFGQNYGAPANSMGYDAFSTGTGKASITLSQYVRKVYLWMFIGLSITFSIGLIAVLNQSRTLEFIESNIELLFGAIIAELVLVFVLGLFIGKMNSTVSLILFFVYSALNGITIAPTLILFEASSAFFCFAVTAGLFGAMAFFGAVTKLDLSKIRYVLLFGLVALLGFTILGFFFHFPMLDLLIGVLGIVIFVGYAAWDSQKIKKQYLALQHNDEMLKRSAVNSALALYLDFINLFIQLLRLFGKRK